MSSTNTTAAIAARRALAKEHRLDYLEVEDQEVGEEALWRLEARVVDAHAHFPGAEHLGEYLKGLKEESVSFFFVLAQLMLTSPSAT